MYSVILCLLYVTVAYGAPHPGEKVLIVAGNDLESDESNPQEVKILPSNLHLEPRPLGVHLRPVYFNDNLSLVGDPMVAASSENKDLKAEASDHHDDNPGWLDMGAYSGNFGKKIITKINDFNS